jgi:hypothetical protein
MKLIQLITILFTASNKAKSSPSECWCFEALSSRWIRDPPIDNIWILVGGASSRALFVAFSALAFQKHLTILLNYFVYEAALEIMLASRSVRHLFWEHELNIKRKSSVRNTSHESKQFASLFGKFWSETKLRGIKLPFDLEEKTYLISRLFYTGIRCTRFLNSSMKQLYFLF